ncbi:unnamed protein product [Sphagnum troendelagicum]|uniref:Uncharacterized protein n=1 Tax=Sphagnum troendelagicum TaxID=128251 RepID=A0ABP0UIH3_9BRYO
MYLKGRLSATRQTLYRGTLMRWDQRRNPVAFSLFFGAARNNLKLERYCDNKASLGLFFYYLLSSMPCDATVNRSVASDPQVAGCVPIF